MTRNIIFAVLLLFAVNSAYSQIVNAAADFQKIDHNVDVNDSTFIFAFFKYENVKLKALSSNETPANFKWYHFLDNSRAVNATPFFIENNVLASEVAVKTGQDMQKGGYLVVVEQGATSDTLRAWIFIDALAVTRVDMVENNCDFLRFNAEVTTYEPNYNYYDYYDFCNLSNVQQKFIKNDFTMEWSADADIRAGLTGLDDDWKRIFNSTSCIISNPAPLASSSYNVVMVNVFGNKSAPFKTAVIPSVTTYASFEVLKKDENGTFLPTTEYKGEALFTIKLKNNSINATKYEWVGYNNQKINFLKNDTLWIYKTETVNNELDYKPGVYPIKLTVENNNCKSVSYSLKNGERSDITVEQSLLKPESVPNVFTPNGDGHNDVFIFVKGSKPVSLQTLEVRIYGKGGNLVYKYDGAASAWQGWNGKVQNDRGECASGVYYYTIKASGWDDVNYGGKPLTGAVHLLRGN